MKKPETVKRGQKDVYPWNKLLKKGDFFTLPKSTDAVKANSCRTSARKKGIKVSVCKMVKGGYLVELLEKR